MLKLISIIGLLVMIAALAGLYPNGSLISSQPVAVAVQIAAIALMVWARVTFGLRSFHAAADPTAGGLVTTGPYHYIRHPIYAAVCLFGWAGVLSHLSALSFSLGVVLLLGGLARMMCEERLLVQTYPEYADYANVTRRMIPYLF
jgi:protein-S-isoprenylcysteine O-methyltransferase Ste14